MSTLMSSTSNGDEAGLPAGEASTATTSISPELVRRADYAIRPSPIRQPSGGVVQGVQSQTSWSRGKTSGGLLEMGLAPATLGLLSGEESTGRLDNGGGMNDKRAQPSGPAMSGLLAMIHAYLTLMDWTHMFRPANPGHGS